jgi:hypothetical protein
MAFPPIEKQSTWGSIEGDSNVTQRSIRSLASIAMSKPERSSENCYRVISAAFWLTNRGSWPKRRKEKR